MWPKYWLMYYEIKADSCYFQRYAVRTARLKIFVSAVCLLLTSASVVAWFQQFCSPWLSSGVILVSQLVAVAQPLFPYEKQNREACYICQDLEALIMEIELTMDCFTERTPEEEIHSQTRHFREEYERIMNRFAKPDTFPKNSRLMDKAEKEARTYVTVKGRF